MDNLHLTKKPHISIVIPSMRHLDDCLRPCLESIVKHTDLANVEVVVVLNGCGDDGSREFVESLGEPFKVIWLDEPSGYTHSTNVGIHAARGEHIILLNNDVVILGAHWINMLLQPFMNDSTVGLTGPLMLHCPDADEDFLVFFCAMISRECLNAIGGQLDEAFAPGYGEDCAAAVEARHAGWKVVQVPPTEPKLVDKGCEDLPQWKRDKMWHNDFPCYHDGNKSFGEDPERFEVVLRKNKKILQERYGKKKEVNTPTNECERCGGPTLDGICIGAENKVNCDGLYLWRAALIDGWFGVDEGAWLAKQVKTLPKGAKVLSVGAWHGRSSRFIADNLSEGGQLWDVDTFNGSSGEPEMHGTAHWDRGDHAYQYYWCNLQEHIEQGRVVTVRAFSENAAQTMAHLIEKGQMKKFDLIFIDGDHSEEGIKTDVKAWLPLLKTNGLICGHDYYKENEGPHWVHVRQYVESKFPDVEKSAASIWHVRPEVKHFTFDCFPLADELLLLETRLNEIGDIVDRFVITEGTLTNTGKPKPLNFQNSLEREPERWARWLNKITYIVVDDFPEPSPNVTITDAAWMRERWQRDALLKGLTDCRDDDIILIGDADEIPSVEAIKSYDPSQGLCRLKQRLFYCYMNCENKQGWDWLKIAPYKLVKELSPCGIRYPPAGNTPIIEDGGFHFSFCGGPDAWIEKLERTAHQEYNRPEYKNRETMLSRVLSGKDLLGREELSYEFVPIDESFPEFVRENIEKFTANQFIYEEAMHPEAYQFVAQVKQNHPEYFSGKKVLEVGSLNINGTVRDFFENCDYTGIDLAAGLSVDRVIHVTEIEGEAYDVIISSEALEHDHLWRESLYAMSRLLKPNGALIITCAAPQRPEHGTTKTDTYSSPFTTNYYRNISMEDFQSVLPMELWADAELMYARNGEDLYFFGVKPAASDKNNAPIPLSNDNPVRQSQPPQTFTITASVSTKDRYTTTLPMAIAAILNQTHKPEKLVIYDDGEQKDLRELSPFSNLFKMADELGIKWEVFATPRKGQVTNHQHCLDTATTDLIWRVDDDEIPEPNCLEKLLVEMRDDVGAVAPLIHHPGAVSQLPSVVDGSLKDISLGLNIQWGNWNSGSKDVEHLYSSFLFRVQAGKDAGGYPKELSPCGHREESIFSHSMKRAGWRLVVTPHTRMWHLRQETGGIRSFNDQSLWEHDEKIFQNYLKAWGVVQPNTKLKIVNMGLGDHLLLRGIWNDIRRKNPDTQYTLALCYPDAFEDVKDVNIISIADAKLIVGDKEEDYNFYAWLWKTGSTKSITDSMMEFYGK